MYLTWCVLLGVISMSLGEPIVQIPDGTIQGRDATTQTGKPYFSFQKIPYASPPIYDLRFQAPIPPRPWNGVLDASQDLNAICMQTFYNDPLETEDCLYLNVFTPELPQDNGPLYPVMFFVYGGSFVFGDSRTGSYGPEYLIDSGVIVVTINYRLGPFGFLSTEDNIIPGNNGLKDQLLALKWTNNNIKAFGGDPDKITIFGQSAGSIGISYQLLNLNSEGLYAGAILESGSFLMPAGFTRNPREIAFATAGFLNDTFNTNQDSTMLLHFLQSVTDPKDIDSAAEKYGWRETVEDRQIYQGFFWAPVIEPEVEGAIFTEKMYVQLSEGRIVKVPVLMGITSEEEIYESGDANQLRNLLQTYDEHLDWLTPKGMHVGDGSQAANIGNNIRQIYTEGAPLADHLGPGVRLLSDNSFNRGIIKHAELQSRISKVYFYQFSYTGALSGQYASYEGADHVGHGAELNYIWRNGGNGNLGGYPEQDRVVQQRIQKIWTDFARYQNPTPESSELLQNLVWPTVDSMGEGNFAYVDITENLEIKNHPKGETYSKWEELYQNLGYNDFDTY